MSNFMQPNGLMLHLCYILPICLLFHISLNILKLEEKFQAQKNFLNFFKKMSRFSFLKRIKGEGKIERWLTVMRNDSM